MNSIIEIEEFPNNDAVARTKTHDDYNVARQRLTAMILSVGKIIRKLRKPVLEYSVHRERQVLLTELTALRSRCTRVLNQTKVALANMEKKTYKWETFEVYRDHLNEVESTLSHTHGFSLRAEDFLNYGVVEYIKTIRETGKRPD